MGVLCAIVPSLFAARPDVTVPPAATRFMLSTPRPEYPSEARLRHYRKGRYEVTFDARSGAAKRVKVLESTGGRILDDGAVKALLHWRARRPGVVASARIPFTFTLME